MPVKKFRALQDMKQGGWRTPGDPDLCLAIARLWAFGRRSGRRRFPPGVFRHRSVEELNALSDEWSAANFHAQDKSRSRSGQHP